MKTTQRRVAIQPLLLLLAAAVMVVPPTSFADGCFVFRWNKQKDINEPTQKAIILHDQNREDLILQVKYEGPAEDFGWLIPVPGKPELRKGSMEPFYELSVLTQRQFREGRMNMKAAAAHGGRDEEEVKVVEVKTIGAYEVTILSSTNPSALVDWLAANHFGFPKEKQGVLDQYIQKHWFFVAARINPEGNGFIAKSGSKVVHQGSPRSDAQPSNIAASTRKDLASGELHPIIISFPTEKCVFPLAISAVNGTPSELSLYVLSAEPLLSPVIFERKLKNYKSEKEKALQARHELKKNSHSERLANIYRDSPLAARMNAEDTADPPPPAIFDRSRLGVPGPQYLEDPEEDFYSSGLQLVRSMSVKADKHNLSACQRDLPRLAGKTWWLTKLVETFPAQEMLDLQFESAIPFLALALRNPDGEAAAHCLPQYGSLAAATVLDALKDSDSAVQARGLVAAAEISDPRFVEPLLDLLQANAAKTRLRACYATANNWDQKFVKPLVQLLRDSEPGVAQAAQYCLRERLIQHPADITLDTATLRAMIAEDGPATLFAFQVLETRGELSDQDRRHLFSSTNLPVLSSAFTPLRDKLQLDDLTPLMTNSLPMARLMALGVLVRMADKPAVERIVTMLHDPNEDVRWRVRSGFRRLTGQKLGAEPAAYEKWWAENKDTYVPVAPQQGSRSRTRSAL